MEKEKVKVLIIIGDKTAKEINPLGKKSPAKFFNKKWEKAEEKCRTFEIENCIISFGKAGCEFLAEIHPNGKIIILESL